MANLTPKQQRFVDEYLIDLNATKASKVSHACSGDVIVSSGVLAVGRANMSKAKATPFFEGTVFIFCDLRYN